MQIDRYNVVAECSCDKCRSSYVQNAIPQLIKDDCGRVCSYSDVEDIIHLMESYEAFFDHADLWDSYLVWQTERILND